MAGNKKISELGQIAVLDGREEFAIVQGGVTQKAKIRQVNNFIVPKSVQMSDASEIDLTDEDYDDTFLIEMSWSGAQGTAFIGLPSVAELNVGKYRTYRFITDSTFSANTAVIIFPFNNNGVAETTIDGNSSLLINKAYEGVKIWNDGNEWFVIQKKA